MPLHAAALTGELSSLSPSLSLSFFPSLSFSRFLFSFLFILAIHSFHPLLPYLSLYRCFIFISFPFFQVSLLPCPLDTPSRCSLVCLTVATQRKKRARHVSQSVHFEMHKKAREHKHLATQQK
ncbi:MAG: hypothetical protein J3R72DRAFT_140284 [Linnemannia gamsii]|nr:MAG: hypothetical protein J3R72DRAFT_140284 [Linnemannia gamsii]